MIAHFLPGSAVLGGGGGGGARTDGGRDHNAVMTLMSVQVLSRLGRDCSKRQQRWQSTRRQQWRPKQRQRRSSSSGGGGPAGSISSNISSD